MYPFYISASVIGILFLFFLAYLWYRAASRRTPQRFRDPLYEAVRQSLELDFSRWSRMKGHYENGWYTNEMRLEINYVNLIFRHKLNGRVSLAAAQLWHLALRCEQRAQAAALSEATYARVLKDGP